VFLAMKKEIKSNFSPTMVHNLVHFYLLKRKKMNFFSSHGAQFGVFLATKKENKS